MDDESEAMKVWRGKMSFAIGVPDDLDSIPKLYFQVLAGQVHVVRIWKDGSVAKGLTTLDSLERRAGKPITREGWYNSAMEYIGSEPPGSL